MKAQPSHQEVTSKVFEHTPHLHQEPSWTPRVVPRAACSEPRNPASPDDNTRQSILPFTARSKPALCWQANSREDPPKETFNSTHFSNVTSFFSNVTSLTCDARLKRARLERPPAPRELAEHITARTHALRGHILKPAWLPVPNRANPARGGSGSTPWTARRAGIADAMRAESTPGFSAVKAPSWGPTYRPSRFDALRRLK